MKVKMIFSFETIQEGVKTLYRAGDVHDLEDDLGKRLVKEGRAEPAKDKPKPPPPPPPPPGGAGDK